MSFVEERLDKYVAEAHEWTKKLNDLQRWGLECKDGDFVPSVHYPPITQYPLSSEEEVFEGYTLPADGRTDLYVHFPFCQQHCTFCHYPGLTGPRPEEKEKYLTALEKEFDLYLRRLGLDRIAPRSILLGGGTPTYMDPKQLDRFLTFLNKRIDMDRVKQYNVDLDPNSLLGEEGAERIRIMKDHGITRLTIGVQSFTDDILKSMNRPHCAKEALESIELSAKAGFKNDIEFIFGYPGQTMEQWLSDIETACNTPTDEIQLYRLKYLAYGDFQGRILDVRTKQPAKILSFEETMALKFAAVALMRDYGFEENLRRVYTKKKNNISLYAYNQCCNLFDQIGIGLTAFSSLRDRFTLNTQSFEEYYRLIDSGHLGINRGYIRDREQQLRWSIILPLKNWWVRKERFEAMNGIPFEKVFRKKIAALKEYGLVTETPNRFMLTPLGDCLADEVAEQFNANEFIPFPRDHYEEGPLNPYLNNTTEDALGLI